MKNRMKLRFLPLLALAVPALTVSAHAQDAQGDDNVIVVTGTPLETTLKALEDCLERGCPPEEDIRLSLAHAENLFVEGEYKDGRRTLLKSLGRNKKHADALPVPVSDLYRANSRIAEHLGEAKSYQLSILDMQDTLEDGLGKDDWRTMVAQVEVGDSRAKLGHPEEALDIYRKVEERAIAAGENRVAMFARIRQALLWQARYETEKDDYFRERMFETLGNIRDNPLKGAEEFRLVADVLQAKFDRRGGNSASTDALVKRFAEQGGVDRPVLLYSEPLFSDAAFDRASVQSNATAGARLSTLSMNNPKWADIGFWIGSDGHVSDIEVLRASGETGWLKPIGENISKRIYAPVSKDSATPGFYMIERYTLTARFSNQTTGTRIRRREPQMRIERLDITPENYEPPVATEG